jgi:hypothetical protein
VSGTDAPIEGGAGATSTAKADNDTLGMINSINPSVAIMRVFTLNKLLAVFITQYIGMQSLLSMVQ